ncbi:hypothetical protein [Bradyrhizobium sp. USDA 4529]
MPADSAFALTAEVRQFFDGALALSGTISNGGAVVAAEAIGCDFAYIGTLFLAAKESMAPDAHKNMVTCP